MHLGEYSGNAGDSLSEAHDSSSDGVKFSTYDHPNYIPPDDEDDDDAKCVTHSKSGWWFSR